MNPTHSDYAEERPGDGLGVNPDCEVCGGSGFYKVDQGDGYDEEYNCPCTEGACDCRSCVARRVKP